MKLAYEITLGMAPVCLVLVFVFLFKDYVVSSLCMLAAMAGFLIASLGFYTSYSDHHDRIFEQHCKAHHGYVVSNVDRRVCTIGPEIKV